MTGGIHKSSGGVYTKVSLSVFDAEAFKLFLQNYKSFMFMANAGVFGLKPGNAVLHFDSSGELKKVDVNKSYVDTE